MDSLSKRRVPAAIRPASKPAVVSVPAPPPLGPATTAVASRELWLAVHLPCVTLDSLQAVVAALPGHPPVVAADLERDGKVVCACDEVAATAGITPGMALNSALALLPELQAVRREPHREHALLEAVGALALRFSPRVSLEPPDAVVLEVRGSLRLFGGARALCERLRTELQASMVTARLTLTPTPLASLWLARAGQEVAFRRPGELAGRLAPLPLAVTRWSERSLQSLATMGVRTLGECLRLPRDGFARRFEPGMLTLLDRALGRAPDPRVPFRAGEKFATRRHLEPEIADLPRLEAAVQPLLEELCTFLRQRGRGVTVLELRLQHREAATRIRLRFVAAVDEAKRIAEPLHERLACVALPEPVRTVRLASGPLVELAETSAELFATDRRASGTAVPRLVERLRARLGTDAVHGLGLVPEHRPESAWRITEPLSWSRWPGLGAVSPRRAAEPAHAPIAALRPLWLLAEPREYPGALEVEEGPERIESGWWDGRDVARDYYIARDPAGVRLWVFRERPRHGGASHHDGWFLHGVFG